MIKSCQIAEWFHAILKSQVQSEGIYLDSTMGNGYDTTFFCELAGEKGKVYAFDIQELAAERTGKLLEQRGLTARAQLILDSHANMEQYIGKEKADCICFNFGYLPGGNHAMATKPDMEAMALLKEDTTSLSDWKVPHIFPYTNEGMKNSRVNSGIMAFIRVEPSIKLPVSGFLIKEFFGIQQMI